MQDINGNPIPRKPGIYLLEVARKHDSKIYIGKVAKDLRRRLQDYPARVKSLVRKARRPIEHAIKKYGWDKVKLKILVSFDFIDDKELIEIEAFLIAVFGAMDRKIGYNVCDIGFNNTNNEVSEKTREKLKRSLGGRKTNYNSKPVNQISPETGEIIKIWSSMIEATYGLGRTGSVPIIDACKGRIERAFGFKWTRSTNKKYEEFKAKNPSIYNIMPYKFPSQKRPLKQIDETGNIINIFSCAREAAGKLGIKRPLNINRVASGERESSQGFKWKYLTDEEYKDYLTRNETTQMSIA